MAPKPAAPTAPNKPGAPVATLSGKAVVGGSNVAAVVRPTAASITDPNNRKRRGDDGRGTETEQGDEGMES